jgi:ACR3 family arsenite transporter
MWTLIALLTRNLVVAVPAAMLLGFAWGVVGPTDWLRALIVPMTFLMVYPMMVNLKVGAVLEGGDAKLQLAAQAINFGLIPFVALGLGAVFFADEPYLALGLLLAALLPTSGMTISWTGFAAGNVPAAVKMTVAGLVLGSLATPFYVSRLMGAKVSIDLAAVFVQIVVIVLLPMVAGQLTRRLLVRRFGQPAFQKTWGPRFPPLSTLGVLGIAFIAIALQARTLLAQPAELLHLVPPLLCLYAANYAISTAVARAFFGRGDAIALVYGTVMRNLSIALALAMNAFGAEGAQTALLIALAYVVQVQSAAWYVRLGDRIFGPKPAPAPPPGA